MSEFISGASQDAATPSPQQLVNMQLARRAAERRAAEAAIWGMPIVNYDLMLQEMLRAGGQRNQIIYWGRPLDWRNQTLTPNPDTLYLMAFLDTRETGPMVVEVPPASASGSLNANFVNIWQQPLEDAGLLGFDKGAGAKLVMLPPGHAGAVPADCTPLRPQTWGSYVLFRSNLVSHASADVARSLAYARQIRIYPLDQAADPAPTAFTDVQDVLFDSTIRYDARFFEGLDRVIQAEPWLERDRAMIDVLKGLGIEKGKAFQPGEAMREALLAGVREAHAELAARYDAGLPPFFEGTHWTYPCPSELVRAAQNDFAEPNDYPVEARGLTYTYGYIGIKHLGAGQFYLIAIKDRDGADFDGGKTYHLHVPTNAPVQQYWSLTAYDRETHALIRHMPRASRASNSDEVKANPDGSVDLYIGPKAPSGAEANWIPSDPARGFELMFRAYGPTPALFDHSWALPDVAPVVMH